jgi:gamma-glutamylcyclotransferase (GGCT)/AIG2-like uncharacterized protein YtfP
MYRVRIFAYGTLLDEKVQWRVFGRVIELIPARLPGWGLVLGAVRGGFRGIVPAPGGETAGALLKIDSRELALADRYEDAPQFYRRLRVTARTGRHRVRTWVYVPAGGISAGVARGRRRGLARRR